MTNTQQDERKGLAGIIHFALDQSIGLLCFRERDPWAPWALTAQSQADSRSGRLADDSRPPAPRRAHAMHEVASHQCSVSVALERAAIGMAMQVATAGHALCSQPLGLRCSYT